MFKLNDVTVYGFAYAKTLSKLDMDDINDNIISRYGTGGEKIYFSTMDSEIQDQESLTWLVAADKKLHEEQIYDIVNYLINENIIYDYLIQSSDI